MSISIRKIKPKENNKILRSNIYYVVPDFQILFKIIIIIVSIKLLFSLLHSVIFSFFEVFSPEIRSIEYYVRINIIFILHLKSFHCFFLVNSTDSLWIQINHIFVFCEYTRVFFYCRDSQFEKY